MLSPSRPKVATHGSDRYTEARLQTDTGKGQRVGVENRPADVHKGAVIDIAIAACTYARIDDLQALLRSFETLHVDNSINLRIIIVDNDIRRSAERIVLQWAIKVPWPIHYVHEPEPGIPAARNRALRTAGNHGYLAFVDDDETVHPDWILELAKAAQTTGAAFVQGPVEMTVQDQSDEWWLRSAFFRQKVFENFAPRHESWTNNVLIDLEFITRHGCCFDDALRYDGGSDTLFFQDVVTAGGEGCFARDAVVYEVQKKSRLTWRWAIKRHYRYGISRANTVVLRKPFHYSLGYCGLRGAAMLGLGLLKLPSCVVLGRRGAADSIALMSRGVGVYSGLLGGKHKEYAR